MSVLAGYADVEELRRGARSTILRAFQLPQRRPVMLNVLNPGSWFSEDTTRFAHDFEVSRSLQSERVVAPYGLEERDGHLVLVLEDFGGTPLDLLVAQRTLALKEVLSIAAMVAEGLQDIHRHGIAHRAVYPSNLICDLSGPQIKLTGFGLSTALARETPSSFSARSAVHDIRYMSPEQTGRMNRSVDYRTDLYSLGIVLYECLTGRLPFESTDELELAYCHMAEKPTPPAAVDDNIPNPVSDIVMRLLAKPPEERYQSAHGLAVDVRACQAQFERTGVIQDVPLGQRDLPERLLVPEKLYGRELQIQELLEAFERASRGRAEMMLVAGYSGIGKSALVNEVHKPIVRRRGYFISGKFDQYQRHIPYSSLIQAFRELARQLLSEPEESIRAWRDNLLHALGSNGQVIIDVIPEVELIIGPQPPVAQLQPNEAQNRFSIVFQHFLKVLARKEHPLVVFLDDLQWADSASLKLLQLLITDPDAAHLLVLGAYRDNEVDSTHPLLSTLREIAASETKVTTITLPPLALPHVAELLADTLRSDPARVAPLAELVHAKTAGNPFFLKQFLMHLYEEHALTLNLDSGTWGWDADQIRAMGTTDNVVELMAGRIQDLGRQTQRVVKLAACIGNRFDLHVLSLVCDESPSTTADWLWDAIHADVVVPLSGGWHGRTLPNDLDAANTQLMFLHDRVQEAAYALIPQEERKATHLAVGRLLLHHTKPAEREERLFDIANQLNTGAELLESQAEREELAALNLEAARKAKAAAAFGPARRFARAGLAQLADDCWETQYDLALNLHAEVVETEYLNANLEEALRISQIVQARARTLLDKVPVYILQVQFLITQNRMVEAIEAALPVIEELGYPVSQDPADLKLAGALPALAEIDDLPSMTDPQQLAALRLLNIITGAAYQGKPEMFAPIVFRIVNLCIENGFSPLAPYGYMLYGVLLCGPLNDIETGCHAGRLALRLLERTQMRELKCKVRMGCDSFIRHWCERHRLTIQAYDETIRIGLETGDIVYATYCCIWMCGYLFLTGHSLTEVEEKQRWCAELMQRFKQENGLYPAKIWRQLTLNLQGHAEDPHRLEGESFCEADMRTLEEVNVVLTLFFVHFARLILAYVFRDFPASLEHTRKAGTYEGSAIASMLAGGYAYYDSLVRLAMYPQMTTAEQKATLERVDAHLSRIRTWASLAPMNYRGKAALVEAERSRALGDVAGAVKGYDIAIDLARKDAFPLEEAIASERAADFYLALGNDRLGRMYLEQARDVYTAWGAQAKTAQLEAQYPQFLTPTPTEAVSPGPEPPLPDEGDSVGALDAMTLLKASQALSSEIELGRLLGRLVTLALENAGAQRAVLILNRNGDPRIEAIATHDAADIEVLQSIPLPNTRVVPAAIVRYVTRTGESVVLSDAANEGRYTEDPYVVENGARSVLCMPIHHHDRVAAVLYLENDLAADVFTEDRLAVLRVLLMQAAISLESAELFGSLAKAEKAVRESEERIRVVLETLPAGVLIIDPDTHAIVEVNPAAAEMIGVPESGIIGKKCWRFVCPAREGQCPITDLGQQVDQAERVLVTSSGDKKAILKSVRAVEIDGKPHLIETFVDISESKRLHEQLRQAQKMEAVGQLAGGVAHDFNNLLQAIQGYTEMAVMTLPTDSPAQEDLSQARTAIGRAATLVRQLLAFSRRDTLRPQNLDLADLIDNLTNMLRRLIGEHIELSVTHSPGLRPIHADPGQLEQVLVNLCLNARDAMPEGGRIAIRTDNASLDAAEARRRDWAHEGDYVLLTVSDTGEGIPTETLEHVFEPFFTTKEVGKGTGMGLATVYGIVKQHDGLIELDSEPGTGTTFRIYLPASLHEPAPLDERERGTESVPGGTETILLAEDEELVRNAAAAILRKAGYTVLVARDGEEAIRVYEETDHEIHLFLLDVVMPKKNGRAVHDKIKETKPDALVLFTSGYSRDMFKSGSLPEEGYELIQKPHDRIALLRKVRELLDGAQASG